MYAYMYITREDPADTDFTRGTTRADNNRVSVSMS